MSKRVNKFIMSKQKSLFDGIKLVESANKRFVGRILRSNIINELQAHYTSAEMYSNLKAQLAAYYNDINNDLIEVEYKMAEYGYGRVYPKLSLSLCCIRREVRHAIVAHTGEDAYVDIDISAAHHEFLLQLVNYFKNDYLDQEDIDECNLGQSLEEFPAKLTDYLANRNNWLKKVMDEYDVNRDDAKVLFIIILYNGGFEGWANILGITKKKTSWLSEFQMEFKFICEWMMRRVNKTWFDDMVKNFSKKTKKKNTEETYTNDIGRFMSIYLQEWERRCLEEMYKYGVKEGLIKNSNTVLCYDGIMIEKKNWDNKHLVEMEKVIEKNVGFKVKLECKSFNQGQQVIDQAIVVEPTEDQQMRFVPSYFKSLELYGDQKEYFERFVCKVRDQGGYFQIHKNKPTDDNSKIGQDTNTVFLKDLTAFKQYSTIEFKVHKVKDEETGKTKYDCTEETTKFIKLWEYDDDLKAYQTVNFIPKNATESQIRAEMLNHKQDEDVFNMFCGYNDILSKTELPLNKDGSVSQNKVLAITEKWRDIVLNLCEGNKDYYDFYINYLSQHLIDPCNKTEHGVIFEGLQGSGKNLHLKPIRNIVGQRYFLETANIDDILGTHAEGYLNKLWVVLNELEGKDSMDFEGQLKSFITEDNKVVNVKFQRPVKVNNFCNLIITTNKKNCIRIDVVSGNRRWCAFRATEKYSYKKGFHNRNQWEQIAKSWENPQFLKCLYYYLTVMTDGTKYNFKIPQTEALKTLIRYSRSNIYYWLESYLDEKMASLSFLRDNSKFKGLATELYNHYKEWCEQSQPDHVLSNQKFKNSIHELGIGIDFFKDTGLNQNIVEFEYKTVYENFAEIYTNKYKEQEEQKPNDLVLYTSYDDIPDDYIEETKQTVVEPEPEPVVEEKKVKIKKVRQDRAIQQATENIQKQIQKNIESRVNTEN